MLTQFDFKTELATVTAQPNIRQQMTQLFGRWHREEDGQTLVEYGLLISLITLAVVAAMTLLGRRVSNFYGNAAGQIPANP